MQFCNILTFCIYNSINNLIIEYYNPIITYIQIQPTEEEEEPYDSWKTLKLINIEPDSWRNQSLNSQRHA